MKKIWNLLNNRKTNIGAFFLLAAVVLQQFTNIWLGESCPDWMPKLIESCQWLGGLFSGVGLTHKGVKSVQLQAAHTK